jgi:hypothetical protein
VSRKINLGDLAKLMALCAVFVLMVWACPTAHTETVNVALGAPVELKGGDFFNLSGGWVVDAGTLTDGIFLPRHTHWRSGPVWWDSHDLADRWVEIDLGALYRIEAFVVQADDNDGYELYYWDQDTASWVLVWDVPNYGPYGSGMQTRPNPADDTERYTLPEPIVTSMLKFNGDLWDGDRYFAVAEIQAFGELAEPVFNPSNGNYYELVGVSEDGVDWFEARDAAAARTHLGMPGHLATLASPQEQEFVVGSFPQIYPNYVWLGASDQAGEGDWQWITGEAWDYTDWDAGEPNGGTWENCLDYSDYSEQWNDEYCERKLDFYLVEYAPEPIAVPLDIKPRSCPNPLNVKSKGVLPVAILGTDDLDVTQVDPASVRLVGVAPLRWALEDVATPNEPFLGRKGARDCNRLGADGHRDLTLKFSAREVIAALGEVDDGDILVLELTGNLKEDSGGTPVVGEDVVRILVKGKK